MWNAFTGSCIVYFLEEGLWWGVLCLSRSAHCVTRVVGFHAMMK